MNDWQVKQIVLAIRAHARAMVAERLWAQAEAGTDVDHVVADADALLAALSASSGGENDAASGGDVASGVSTRSQDVSGHREPAVAPEVNPSETQAATPPLSADLAGIDDLVAAHGFVTVRRDDLRILLERQGGTMWVPHAPEWFVRIREAVGR